MPADLAEVCTLLALGLFAGTAGGLVGLGGSIVMIPVLTLLMHRDQHLAQASAMTVNVFIAGPSVIRHRRAGTLDGGILAWLLPVAVVFILVGVAVSNQFDGRLLRRIFGVFLIYVTLMKILRMYRTRRPQYVPPSEVGWLPVGAVGAGTGFSAGLLGIGGGPIAVPLLQRLCRLPLRQSIAASSATMCITSVVGAAYKNLSLDRLTDTAGLPLGLHARDSLLIAACVAPTAALGALYGAGLTHRLPLFWVRLAFVMLMAWASVMMLRG